MLYVNIKFPQNLITRKENSCHKQASTKLCLTTNLVENVDSGKGREMKVDA